MRGYLIFEIEITDPAAWAEYRRVAGPVMAASDGRFLLRSESVEPLEGGWEPASISVVEFPSYEAARGFYDSDTYRELSKLRQKASRSRGILVRVHRRQRLSSMNTGRNLGENIIEATGLTKRFFDFAAVSDVDLTVRRGSIHALIGPNGAGKTTTFNLITKALPPTEGRIVFNGRDITGESPARVARRGLVRSFQISAIFPRMTVAENVRIALQRPLGTSYHFWRSEKTLAVLAEQVDALLESVGLADQRDQSAAGLPYGRKRALEFATTLALEPELMLLDEPTAGLGHEDVDRISGLIRKVSADRTILMVEHNLQVVADLADTITVLARGKVLAEGSYADISTNPLVVEAYIGGTDDA